MDRISNVGPQSIWGNISNDIKTRNTPQTESFWQFLQHSIEKVNDLQLQADKAAQDFLLGKDVNIHQVMIAIEKANISLQLMVQIRNKIINAYEEMMRMQI